MGYLRRASGAQIVAVLLLLSLWSLGAAEAPLAVQEPVPIAPGTTYTRIYSPEGPWAIHVVEADLSQEYVELRTLLGGGGSLQLASPEPAAGRQVAGPGARMGRRAVVEMLAAQEREGRRAVAGVNGDFFALGGGEYAMIPLGLQVVAGELVTFPDAVRSALYVQGDRSLHIGRFRADPWLRGPDDLLYPLAAMNRPPGYSDLVLFTPRFGEETRAEEGTTHFALVGLSGPMRPNAEVTAKIASITETEAQAIPPNGAVLAARGVAAYALRRLKVGDEVVLYLRIKPEVEGIREAVGGGPRLVRDGVVSVEHLRERFSPRFASRRHPRTGVGVRDGTLVMVAVDGRQPGYSEGMTLYELAELFVRLGCAEAMNLDGGGSTTMVVRDRVVNSPSSGMPRAVANAVALLSRAPTGPPVRLSVAPTEASVLSGERVALSAMGLDENHNAVPVPEEDLVWRCASALGEVNEAGTFTAAEVSGPVVGLVTVRYGEMMAACVVRVVPAPTRVVVAPGKAALAPEQAQQFFAYAYDDQNRAMQLPPGRVAWSCEPEEAGAWIDQSGLLVAPPWECRVTVKARVVEVCGEAEVVVGAAPTVLEDFEEEGEWSYRGQPADVPGSVARAEDPIQSENHCLCLKYDFSEHTGTRTAHAELDMSLPETRALLVRVLGDGRGGWLRARLRDGAERSFAVSLADRVDWSGEWRLLTAWLPEGAEPPVTLESVYLAEFHDELKSAGEIYLDDISAAWGSGPVLEPAAEGEGEAEAEETANE